MISARELELTGCRLFSSCDLDETRLKISRVMQPHRLQSIGEARAFRSRMDFVDIAGLGLGIIKFGEMRVIAREVANYHLLILCRRGAGVVRTPGGELIVNPHRGVCLTPGMPLDAAFSPDCEQFVLRIGEGLFSRHTGIPDPNLRLGMDLTRSAFQPWLRLLWALAGSTEMVQRSPQVTIEYQHLLLNMLVDAACPNGGKNDVPIAPFSVKRAEAFIHENASLPICLQDIAQAADVPTRTLFASFKRFRGTSPMNYLRNVRLERVRRRLLDGAPSVTVAAADEGFLQMGRFASEYAARFGEKPSQTLRSARRRSSN